MCLTLRGSPMEQRIHESGLSGTLRTQPDLIDVPLERVERALRWLHDHAKVAARDGRVAVVGASKGAELPLHRSDSRRIPRPFLVEGWREVMR